MWSVAENDRYALTEGQVLRASKTLQRQDNTRRLNPVSTCWDRWFWSGIRCICECAI